MRYVSTPVDVGSSYGVLVGGFDYQAVTKALHAAGAADVSSRPYADEPGLRAACVGGAAPPATDTEVWMRWARLQPQQPCP